MIFFLNPEQVIRIHDAQLQEHGGLAGYRDRGAVESIVARISNFHFYEGESDLFVLAAAYLQAISRGHGFSDANKRTALLASLVFLEMNGLSLCAPVNFADYVAEVARGIHDIPAIAEELRKLID